MPSLAIATCTATFRDSTGALVDPILVNAYLSDPDGVETEYNYAQAEITRSSVGVYTFDASCDRVGYWNVRWYAETATLKKTRVATFEVTDT